MAGVGAGVAGGFTLHHLLIVFRTVIPIIGEPLPLETPIRAYDSNVIPYTQVSVGLAIGLAILGLFVSISIFLRCCDGSNSDGKKKVARRIIHGMVSTYTNYSVYFKHACVTLWQTNGPLSGCYVNPSNECT